MKELVVDPHALSECPTCGHDLLRDTDFKTYFCSNCGWVLPTAWELFQLLRQARNWVQDKDGVLRKKITQVAPPERRDGRGTRQATQVVVGYALDDSQGEYNLTPMSFNQIGETLKR